MLKIPTFVLGGLLILTGLAGYLFQDPGLSIKLTGPFANDAKLTLSDGTETHEILVERSVFASSDAPGEHAYWLISRLNATHANEASKINYAVDQGQGSDNLKKKSFWYASSRGETLAALMKDGTEGLGQVDKDSSTIRFVYKNAATNSGPPTLQVSNWKNIDIEPKPKPNEKLEFGKSWTPLIPAIIGLVLILLVLLAEAKPNARKHVMHGAVLFGLLSFAMVAKRVWPAISEMNWLKGNDIYPPPLLKPSAMLISAGILLIFVILCVVSFIQARKDMAAQAKKEALAKKKESKDKPEDKGEKKKEDGKDKDASDTKDASGKPKRPDASGDPAKESTKSKPKGLPIRKPVDQTGKKASFDLKSKKAVRTPEDSDDKDRKEEKNEDDSEKEDKKDPGKDDGGAKEKPENEKGGDSDERKDSDEQPDKDSPSPVSEESEETQKKNGDDSEKEDKKDSEKDTGFSYKKPEDGTSGDSGEKKDSDEQADKNAPSPAREESEETPEKKEDDSDAGEKEESGEPKDSSNDKPEEK